MGKNSRSKFQNKKLDLVVPILIEKMVNKYTVILRLLSDKRSEEVRFNRFVNNDKVTPER